MEDFKQTKHIKGSPESKMSEGNYWKDCVAGVVYHFIYEKGESPGAKGG